ncbi:MAG: glycosyltransferase 87 family protein [Rhodoglobus sp.]|nr:glycosyltransferase 87 family protein [Rhodoglobus sp.]
MSETSPLRGRSASVVRAVAGSPISLWAAFVVAHLWLGLLNLYAPGQPLGDVTIVYKFWMDQGIVANFWVGIDSSFVYPIVALVPMLIAYAFGPALYASTWLSMVMVINAVAFAFVTGWGRSRERVSTAWWWIAFLVALGPIALGRIDTVTIALAIVGVLLIARAPRAAVIILTVATWIKVWPAALLAAAVIALRGRLRIVAVALATTTTVVAIALLLGSGSNLLSFITEQTDRGLQIEAPISTGWLWRAAAGDLGTFIYYDQQILTFQVSGPGVDSAAALMTPLLVLGVVVICLLGVRGVRAGVQAGDLFPPLSLALVSALIAFNKVGSPQFIGWLAVPVVLGLATHAAGYGRSFQTPAILALVTAALTQLVYPTFYTELLSLNVPILIVLAARNIFVFVILGWSVLALATRPVGAIVDDESQDHWLPSVWPFPRDTPAGEVVTERSTKE